MLATALSFLAAAGCVAGPKDADSTSPPVQVPSPQPTRTSQPSALPPQGGYSSCGVEWNWQDCYKRLDVYATGTDGVIGHGFKFLNNMIGFAACATREAPSGSCAHPGANNRLPAYLAHAAKDGMQIWLRLKPYDPNGLSGAAFVSNYPDFAASCDPPATTNRQFIACAAAIVKSQSGFGGWTPDDEPGKDLTRAAVDKSVCDYIATLDTHPCWLVQGVGGDEQDVAGNFDPYSWLGIYGGDYFPWQTPTQDINQIAQQLAHLRQAAKTANYSGKLTFTVQAFAWCQEGGSKSQCTWPGVQRIQRMRDEALREHMDAIQYYSFDDVMCLDVYSPPWCDAVSQMHDLKAAAFAPPPSS